MIVIILFGALFCFFLGAGVGAAFSTKSFKTPEGYELRKLPPAAAPSNRDRAIAAFNDPKIADQQKAFLAMQEQLKTLPEAKGIKRLALYYAKLSSYPTFSRSNKNSS